MDKELEKELKRIFTYQCPEHGDFEHFKDAAEKNAKCPSCGIKCKRVRLSAREKSISGHVAINIPTYIRRKINLPLFKVVIMIANRLDFEPTINNTQHELTHFLLDLRDRFFLYFRLKSRLEFYEAAWKLISYKIETDRHYRSDFYFLAREIVKAVLSGELRLDQKNLLEWEYWDEPEENVNNFEAIIYSLAIEYMERYERKLKRS